MNKMVRLGLLAATAALGACTANSYCLGAQDYQKAPSVEPLRPADNVKLSESATALRIPPPAAKPVPYGQKVKNAEGDEVAQCLDKPPEMPPPAEPKTEVVAPPAPAAATPAPATTPPAPEAPKPEDQKPG